MSSDKIFCNDEILMTDDIKDIIDLSFLQESKENQVMTKPDDMWSFVSLTYKDEFTTIICIRMTEDDVSHLLSKAHFDDDFFEKVFFNKRFVISSKMISVVKEIDTYIVSLKVFEILDISARKL